MTLARIGLGSNDGDAAGNVRAALAALESVGRVVARSALYRSPPWGVTAQADFVNAAALLETPLRPRALLDGLQRIERELGRVPTYRWGPRVIDLDLLTFGDERIDEPDLVVPHPRLLERAFALVPLAEIDPAFTAAALMRPAAERDAIWRIPEAATRTSGAVGWDEALERVRAAADFCASAGLARVRIEEDDLAVEVRRAPRPLPAPAVRAAAEAAPGPNGVHANGASSVAEKPKNVLKAEFVGIVRLSRPTVVPGSVIAADRELAYVEALGIRNPVRSGGPSRVAEIFVTDGQAVEYGQPLFALET